MTGSERRDDDFSWLPGAIPGFRAMAAKYDLEWPCELARPAHPEACDRAERELGLRLPPSLRAFYLAHDGGEVAHYHIRSVSELVEQTLRSRIDDPQTYDEPVDDLLDAIDLGDGNRYMLEASKPSASGEYPVLDAFHEYGPSEWRAAPVAASFGAWLRGIFDHVAQERDPFGEGPLAESTLSARYLIESAAALVAEGRPSEARLRVLRAVAFADYHSRAEEGSPFARAIQRLAELGSEHEGDAFLLRLLQRTLAAVRLAARRGEDFGFRIYCGDAVFSPKHFAERNGVPPPTELAGIMRAYGSITLFEQERYPAPLSASGASLVLYGGAHNYLRRVEPPTCGCRPDAQVIGAIGSAGWAALRPHDLLIWESSSGLSRVPFRPPREVWRGPLGGPVPLPLEQASPPIPVAASIDQFVADAFSRYEAGRPPYDL